MSYTVSVIVFKWQKANCYKSKHSSMEQDNCYYLLSILAKQNWVAWTRNAQNHTVNHTGNVDILQLKWKDFSLRHMNGTDTVQF